MDFQRSVLVQPIDIEIVRKYIEISKQVDKYDFKIRLFAIFTVYYDFNGEIFFKLPRTVFHRFPWDKHRNSLGKD